MVTICCPTLNRYDLLLKMIESAEEGTVVPDRYIIVDNGGSLQEINNNKVEVYRPGYNLGVAASWNVLIRNSDEYRIITNDDIIFNLDTVELMINRVKEGFGIVLCHGFSCFMIQNKTIESVGWFDEDISPGYGYFEDNDYAHRLKIRGIKEGNVPNVTHPGSSTLKKKVQDKMADDHARRFDLAKTNYFKKWGKNANSGDTQ